jgi:hypothetical protein
VEPIVPQVVLLAPLLELDENTEILTASISQSSIPRAPEKWEFRYTDADLEDVVLTEAQMEALFLDEEFETYAEDGRWQQDLVKSFRSYYVRYWFEGSASPWSNLIDT